MNRDKLPEFCLHDVKIEDFEEEELVPGWTNEEVIKKINAGLDDIRNGRVGDFDELMERVRIKIFGS